MNTINSFTIYREYYDLITLLSSKEQANVLLAIVKYVFDDELIKLNTRENKVFVNLKRPLDKSKNKSKNASKQNQNEIKMKSNEVTHHDVNVNVNDNVYVNVNNLYGFIEDNFNRTLSPIECEQISLWEDSELTRYAIKQAVLNGACSIKYISRILENFERNNIKTVQQAQQEEQKFKNKTKMDKPEWINKTYDEEQATDEEIKKLEERLKGR